jgi:putative ABC transport system ATP-binding protein
VAIMGPSGCGKTTLLNVLGLLDTPTSGEYLFHDVDVTGLPEKKRALLRKRHFGFVFQNFNLIDELTVEENIELPLLYRGGPAGERRERVCELIERLALAPHRSRFPGGLSGGQQQRTAVARAMACRPEVLFADEPTGNLDSMGGDEVMRLLSELNEEGTAVIMVTHSPEYAGYGHRVIHLLDGRVVSEHIRGPRHAEALSDNRIP